MAPHIRDKIGRPLYVPLRVPMSTSQLRAQVRNGRPGRAEVAVCGSSRRVARGVAISKARLLLRPGRGHMQICGPCKNLGHCLKLRWLLRSGGQCRGSCATAGAALTRGAASLMAARRQTPGVGRAGRGVDLRPLNHPNKCYRSPNCQQCRTARVAAGCKGMVPGGMGRPG
jgi:hypothetical protein